MGHHTPIHLLFVLQCFSEALVCLFPYMCQFKSIALSYSNPSFSVLELSLFSVLVYAQFTSYKRNSQASVVLCTFAKQKYICK